MLPSSSPTALLNASMNLSLFIAAMSDFDFALWFMSKKKDRGVTTLHVLKNRWELWIVLFRFRTRLLHHVTQNRPRMSEAR